MFLSVKSVEVMAQDFLVAHCPFSSDYFLSYFISELAHVV